MEMLVKSEENTKEISKNTLKTINKNLVLMVITTIYVVFLIFANSNMEDTNIAKVLQICSGVFLIIGISLFERAYATDSGKNILIGIECLVICVYSLMLQHILKMYTLEFEKYVYISLVVVLIYYIAKIVIIYTKDRRSCLKEFSDIAEITKKEEPKKKEATKKSKPKNKINDKEIIIEEKITSKETKSKTKKPNSNTKNKMNEEIKKRKEIKDKNNIKEISKETKIRKKKVLNDKLDKTNNTKISKTQKQIKEVDKLNQEIKKEKTSVTTKSNIKPKKDEKIIKKTSNDEHTKTPKKKTSLKQGE